MPLYTTNVILCVNAHIVSSLVAREFRGCFLNTQKSPLGEAILTTKMLNAGKRTKTCINLNDTLGAFKHFSVYLNGQNTLKFWPMK